MDNPAAPPEGELEKLLGEESAAAVEREKSAFDRLVEPFGRSLVLFGAGNLGRRVLARLRADGIEPLGFVDNNPARWGGLVDGVRVHSPREAAEAFGRRAAFIVTIWSPGSGHRYGETRERLLALGCLKVVSCLPFMWKHPEQFLPDCFLDLPHKLVSQRAPIMDVFAMWEDEASRSTYTTQIAWRIVEDYHLLPPCTMETQYFPGSLFRLGADETLVDCGAFDGDTIKVFLAKTGGSFRAVHAFEPDALNFGKLEGFTRGLTGGGRVCTYHNAVGSQYETLHFSITGTASSIVDEAGGEEVQSVPLDGVLTGVDPTFIKMDIEGAELDALEGARDTIRRALPTLAICVYHRQDHLWRIPLLIRSLAPEYRLYLRPHQEEGWDLVCYALPPHRQPPPGTCAQ